MTTKITTDKVGTTKIGGVLHEIWQRHERFFGISYQCVPIGKACCGYAWQNSIEVAKRKRRNAIKSGGDDCVCGDPTCEHSTLEGSQPHNSYKDDKRG